MRQNTFWNIPIVQWFSSGEETTREGALDKCGDSIGFMLTEDSALPLLLLFCKELYWVGQKVPIFSLFFFFYKIKDTVFISTSNFVDLGIVRMSAISHMV